MLIILLLHGAPGKLAVPPRPQVLSWPIEVLRDSDLTKSGQHDRTPVTTKHEKRLYANPLFAVSYGSFQGRPFHSNPLREGR
jgi:hypothetical protein